MSASSLNLTDFKIAEIYFFLQKASGHDQDIPHLQITDMMKIH